MSRLEDLYRLRLRVDEEIAAAERAQAFGAQPRQRRSRYDIPTCGTETAYQRHRTRREDLPVDDPCGCRAAHAEHNRIQEANRRAAQRRNQDTPPHLWAVPTYRPTTTEPEASRAWTG